jgi:hypothetical protein
MKKIIACVAAALVIGVIVFAAINSSQAEDSLHLLYDALNEHSASQSNAVSNAVTNAATNAAFGANAQGNFNSSLGG